MSVITQLADLCRANPTRAKWVIVPTHPLGNVIAERLAREGTNWANLRFVTPLDLAVRMAGPYLVEAGIDPTDDTLGPALVMRLLLALPNEGGYFRPMADQPSMADALWRSFMELRLAGIKAEGLPAHAFASPAKALELRRLLGAYEHHLESTRVADAAVLFEHAPRYPDFCPISADDVRLEWPGTLWPPLVRRFLDALPGDRRSLALAPVHGLTVPRRALSTASVASGPPDSRTSEHGPSTAGTPGVPADVPAERPASRLQWLMSPGRVVLPDDPRATADGSLQMFHAGGREAELEEVLRRIVVSGLRIDQVEIACASDAYTVLAWEKVVRLGWKVTLARGVPGTFTRPARALLAWCHWLDLDFAASRLRRLLQSGDLDPSVFSVGDEKDGRLSPGQAARLLLRAEAAWGRHTYAAAFANLASFYLTRADDVEREDDQRARDRITALRVKRLAAWVESLLADVPAASDREAVDLQAIVAAARRFLADNAARTSALDALASTDLDEALGELGSLGCFSTTRATALRFVRERVDALRIGADRARPGHLHVSSLHAAGLAGREFVFVVGLEEGRVFPVSVEDPVLLDDERRAIHPALRTSGDRMDEAVSAVVSAIVTVGEDARAGVCLSYSSRDTREFRATFPSWIVLQAFRVLRGHPAAGYGELSAFLGEPASAVPHDPSDAVNDAGWWLANARRNRAAAAAGVLEVFPWLRRGADALAARASSTFTPWDGFVPGAGSLLDPAARGWLVSATTLEDAAKCPFQYFLRRGLGIEPLDEEEREHDTWLNPLRRGAELHALFADALRQLRDAGRRPGVEDVSAFVERGRRRLADLARELPPPSDDVFLAESEAFLTDLRVFMETECERVGSEPVGFEVSFGMRPGDDAREPLAIEDPVVVPVGGGAPLRLRGRIDRIDRLSDGTYETIDYKTGSYWRDGWRGVFAGGTRLQHALYGVAAETMLERHAGVTGARRKPRVTRGTYYFPSVRGYGKRKAIPTPARGVLATVLHDLLAVIRAGVFVQDPGGDACKWCDYTAACGFKPHERTKPKLADDRMAPYRKLQAHE